MPHQCTNCSHTFADGSKEMLSGCPNCGGNKFQFLPADGDPPTDPDPPERAEPSTVTKTAARASTTVRDLFGSSDSPVDHSPEDGPDDGIVDGEDTPAPPEATSPLNEDRAQAAARSGTVPEHQLPERSTPPEPVDRAADTRQQMDLADLREELNDQFESIKIVDRGQYELNLMELYEREEYIISLQENGRYAIEVPESVRSDIG